MDKIPPELLHNIFIQLNLQQRLLCLNVCRSWWRVLDKHSLFYSVEMREDNLQFYRMMKLLQQFPDRAAQVVNLDVVIAADSFFNRRKLINIFPNARVIRVAPYAVSRLLEFVRHNLLTETTHLKPTVESISEYHHCDLLSQMLYSGLLGWLKVLDLNFHGVEDIPPILSQLKDLPVLKKLTLQFLVFIRVMAIIVLCTHLHLSLGVVIFLCLSQIEFQLLPYLSPELYKNTLEFIIPIQQLLFVKYMDKLPSKILNKIFIQLELQQRLKCLLVCRNWWKVLDKYSLFYDIHLDESENKHQLDRFIDMFERLPDRAAQVEELDIAFLPETSFDKRSIVNIFPNARVVKTIPSLPILFFRDNGHFKTPIDLTHSNSKIEFLSDHNNCELTCQISTSNLGGRLEVLYLNLYRVPDVHNIFSQLKGLSVLKKLSLKFAQIRLWCLEELHRNIPSIEDFVLDNLTVMDGIMPSNIVPATCITKFKLGIKATSGSKSHKEFYQYMTKKYINITDIEYIDAALPSHSADERKSIYLDGILDFYKLIGPNIDELNLEHVPDCANPFEALDAVGSKIRKFDLDIREAGTIYDYLCQSNQSKYIEKLGLCLPNFCSPDIIKRIPRLTELSLTLSHHHSFVDYLDACPPSLKHLTLKSQYLTRTPLPSHVYSIETLVIESKILNSSIGNVITYCLPNLVKLTLKGELRESLNIKLTHPALQKATFYLKSTVWSMCSHLGFLYKSPNHTETKYWLNGVETTTPINDKDIKGIPVLSVVSLTEKKLCFNDGYREINIISC